MGKFPLYTPTVYIPEKQSNLFCTHLLWSVAGLPWDLGCCGATCPKGPLDLFGQGEKGCELQNVQEAKLSVPGPSGWGNIVTNKDPYRAQEHELVAQHYTKQGFGYGSGSCMMPACLDCSALMNV